MGGKRRRVGQPGGVMARTTCMIVQVVLDRMWEFNKFEESEKLLTCRSGNLSRFKLIIVFGN